MTHYNITIAGVERSLPIVEVAPGVKIALFISLGDCEVCEAAAEVLAKKLPKADVLLTAETKGISIAHALTQKLGLPRYVVARKSAKAYMDVRLQQEVYSISSQVPQTLYLDASDVAAMQGKKVIIIDDVISTGESLTAMEKLIEAAGGEIVAKAAILAEGDAKDREDILYVEELPLF